MDDSPFNPALKLLAYPAHLAHFQSEGPDAWKYPPIGVEISPTNSCNAKCPWCFYVSSEYKNHHSEDELSIDILSGLIESLWRIGVKSVDRRRRLCTTG